MLDFARMFTPQGLAETKQTAVELSGILRQIYEELHLLNAQLQTYNRNREEERLVGPK